VAQAIILNQDANGNLVTTIVGGIAAVVGAAIGGFWQWWGGRKKVEAEATKVGMDAQAAVMNGFILLLNEFKKEREVLVGRIAELEQNNLRYDRRIMQLERLMHKNDLEVPVEE
jgi:uncharacterized membrane protein YeaQ/YmgE (transglycosylase-associated protein family)